MIILYALPPGAVNMVHQCVGPPPSLHTPFPSPNITQFEGNNSWRL